MSNTIENKANLILSCLKVKYNLIVRILGDMILTGAVKQLPRLLYIVSGIT